MKLTEIELTELCRHAYLNEKHEAPSSLSSFDLVEVLDWEGAEAMILTKGKSMLIVFRGTEIDEASDLLTIFKSVFTARHECGRVHRGFLAYHNNLIASIKARIRKLNPETVVCAGHSMGGAIACLTAATLAHDLLAEPHVFTIGSPRVGKRDFCDAFTALLGDRHHSYAVRTDIVPHLPPFLWPFAYKHAGTPVEIDASTNAIHRSLGAILFCALGHFVGLPAIINRPARALASRMGLSFLIDHSCGSYLDAFKQEGEQRAFEGNPGQPLVEIDLKG